MRTGPGTKAIICACFGLAATVTRAQTPPSDKPATAASDDTTSVVVTGKRKDVVDKIDRRTYDIRKDPQAKTGVIVDILKKLPSVTISPDGQIALRGDPGVTVMVDGKVPANGNAAIRTLPSADVDRVEIMTNPSAQYDPQGTAGIINIFTNKRTRLGLSGNLNGEITTFGNPSGAASLAFTRGRWTFGGGANTWRVSTPFHGGAMQQSLNPATGTFDVLASDSRGRFNGTGHGADIRLGYKLSDKATLTFLANNGSSRDRNTSLTTYQTSNGDFSESPVFTSTNDYDSIDANYVYASDVNAEHLTLDANRNSYRFGTATIATDIFTGGAMSVYGFTRTNSGSSIAASVDYERTFDQRILTTGASWTRATADQMRTYDNIRGLHGPQSFDSTHDFTGTRALAAAYATLQVPLGKWTLLPGLRLEAEDLDLTGSQRVENTDLYPTLHLSRNLGAKTKAKLSYSKRVQRPSPDMYDPTIQYNSPLTASIGNPYLRPVTTDAFEMSYDYASGEFSADTTVYYRVNRDQWEPFIRDIGDSVLLTTVVNTGHSASGGAEFSVRGPIGGHWKYAFDGNLFYNQMRYLEGVAPGRRSNFVLTGNSSLEYNATKRGDLDGDQYQVTLDWRSKTLQLQGYSPGNYRVAATWRHALNDRLSVVASADDIFNSAVWIQVVDTPTLKTRSIPYPRNQSLKIALAYKIGS